jgi:hypothetical protein
MWELAARRQATRFSQRLAERWVREQADGLGLLYIDGHVRPYYGTAHRLPEAWVARRRLCQAATTDIGVNQLTPNRCSWSRPPPMTICWP